MHGHEPMERGAPVASANLDPVCGMEAPPQSPHRLTVGTVEFRFCSAHCKERFARHPEAFMGPPAGDAGR